jgi:hypothetical protein
MRVELSGERDDGNPRQSIRRGRETLFGVANWRGPTACGCARAIRTHETNSQSSTGVRYCAPKCGGVESRETRRNPIRHHEVVGSIPIGGFDSPLGLICHATVSLFTLRL